MKDIIQQLHDGKTIEDVKGQLMKLLLVSAVEIGKLNKLLLMEGLPVEEIQRLCDVHASVFKGSIEEYINLMIHLE